MTKPSIDLKALREQKGWSQVKTAKELGFSRSYFSEVEAGRQAVSKGMMYAIIQVFGIKYEDFYRNADTAEDRTSESKTETDSE